MTDNTKFETDRAEMIRAWRMVTRGLGVPEGSCDCALCGESPHPWAKTVKQFLPAHFPFPDLVDRSKDAVCAGCVKIFGGKPSKTDPPVRTRHVAVVGGKVHLHKRIKSLHQYLVDPDSADLLSWGTSQKKHHLVFARVRTSSILYIGSDNETLPYGPAERGLLPVIEELLTGFGSTTIIEGTYSSVGVQKFGANRWAELESRTEELRRRSPLLLQLLTYATPKPETDSGKTEREAPKMAPEDDAAAYLIGEIARASQFRREEGLKFWRGFFLNRIQRFKRLPLPDLVAKLLQDCRVESHQADGVTTVLREIERDGMTDAVSRAIHDRPALIAALAYDFVQAKRSTK